MGHPNCSTFPQLTPARVIPGGSCLWQTAGKHSRWLFQLTAAQSAEVSGALLPLPHTVEVLVYLRNIHSFGKRSKHPASRFHAGKDAFHHAEFLTAFCCRHKLILSLLQPIQTLCWCGHYRVQAQFVCPEVGQAAQATGFPSSRQAGTGCRTL